MRFEARDLKEYAEPVEAGQLEPGCVYFAVQFLDEEMLVPILEPWVFLGRDLRKGDVHLLYFQSFESHSGGLTLQSATQRDRESFQITSERGIKHIFEYDRALDVLMTCALRRTRSQSKKAT